MNITFAAPGGLSGVSGGHRYNRRLVEYLNATGDDVDVVSLPERPPGQAVYEPLPRPVRQQLARPADVLLIDALAHPAVVGTVSSLDGPDAVVALVHYLRTAAPHEGPAEVARWLETMFANAIDAAVVTSNHTKERLANLAAVPTAVAYPGGRTQPTPSLESVAAQAREEQFRVVFVGALTPRKQPLTLVDALATFDTTVDGDWTATLIGPTEADLSHTARVERAVHSAGLSNTVEMKGVVAEQALTAAFNRAHVLVAPSQYEPFGMAVLEAMERGTVPITTTAGGPPEFVTHDRSGLLIDPVVSGRISDALVALAEDRSKLESLAVGAVQAAQNHPSWEESLSLARSALANAASEVPSTVPKYQEEKQ